MTDRVERWKADYAAGLSTHAISAKYEIAQNTVWMALKDAGVMRERSYVTNKLRARSDEVVALYKEHQTMYPVAKHFGVSIGTVATVLDEAGVERRAPSRVVDILRRRNIRSGALGPILNRLPPEELESLILAASSRGKTIAEVLVEDWEPL